MRPIDHLQVQIRDWGVTKFGVVHMQDIKVRALRMVEEAIEYCQSTGLQQQDVEKVLQHVFARPVDYESLKELGGVLLTAFAAADTQKVWAYDLLTNEVQRVLSKNDGSLEASEYRKQKAGLVP